MTDSYTTFERVAVVSAIADVTAPLLSEIEAGLDITYQLLPSGLALPRTTESLESTLWRNTMLTKRPTRVGLDGAALQASREASPNLWDLAIFKARAFLVVRRSETVSGRWDESPFHGGETADVYTFQFGDRSPDPTDAGEPITFTVPIFISAVNEGAVLVDDVIDDELGMPLSTELGGFLLTESA